MNTSTEQQTKMETTQKQKRPAVTELTFVKVVKYTKTITKKEFMEDKQEHADGKLLTEEEKKELWKRLVKRSYCGEIEYDDVYDEEDENGDWTEDVVNDIMEEEIAEMEKKNTSS